MRGLVACVSVVVGLASCYVDGPKPKPLTRPPEPRPALVAEPPPAPLQVEPKRDAELYSLDEALADVFSGPLEHIGTGPWFGLFRVNACAYRNARVIVVNIYCTTKEMKAFSIVVLSRERGRAVIYAEAEKPISQLRRGDYFTFKAETSPPPDASLPPLSLAWKYEELTAWDEKRYYKWVPGCYGGVEIRKPQGGCLQALASHADEWKARNQPFLDDPPADWYRIVREMRARAQRDGKFVAHPGG
ncbi:MAG TPA: hypothetical protein VIV40_10565 [Kofleriaceae bacterium]